MKPVTGAVEDALRPSARVDELPMTMESVVRVCTREEA